MLRTFDGLVKKAAIIALLAGLAGCQAADGTNQAPDVAMVNSLMKGLGAVDPNEKPIDYKPRAPLALPAETTALPEPETEVAGVDSENWPKQQENEQLRELKQIYAGSGGMSGTPLTPEQMRGFRITGVTGTAARDLEAERRDNDITEGATLTRAEQKAEWERLQQLRAQKAGLDQDGLMQRRYLTDPPTSFSTPSPDAPMPQVVKKERKGVNYDPYDSTPIDPRCLEGQEQFCR